MHYPDIHNKDLSKNEMIEVLNQIKLGIVCPTMPRDKVNNYIEHNEKDSMLMHYYLDTINKLFHAERDENYNLTKEVEEKIIEILKSFTNRY